MIAIRWSAKVNMLAPRWLMTVLHNRTWWGDGCPHSSSDWTSSKHITPWSRSRFDDVQSLHVYWKKTPRALDFNLHSTLLIRRVQIKFNVLKSNVRVFFFNIRLLLMSIDLKRKFFVATIDSILLYGCEAWTLTNGMEKALDGSDTRMLRIALNVHWIEKMTNVTLYGPLPKLSDKIAARRLRLAGHCQRHPELGAHRLIL